MGEAGREDELARIDKCGLSHCSELGSPLTWCSEFATAVKLNHIDKGVCSVQCSGQKFNLKMFIQAFQLSKCDQNQLLTILSAILLVMLMIMIWISRRSFTAGALQTAGATGSSYQYWQRTAAHAALAHFNLLHCRSVLRAPLAPLLWRP